MYIDVLTLLKRVAKEANYEGSVYHGRVSDANLFIENNIMPQVHIYPFRMQKKPNANGIDFVPNVLLAFIFQDSPSSSDEDREEIINKADVMQTEFRRLLENENVDFSNYEAEPFFKQFSGVTSGMFVRFQLTAKSKSC